MLPACRHLEHLADSAAVCPPPRSPIWQRSGAYRPDPTRRQHSSPRPACFRSGSPPARPLPRLQSARPESCDLARPPGPPRVRDTSRLRDQFAPLRPSMRRLCPFQSRAPPTRPPAKSSAHHHAQARRRKTGDVRRRASPAAPAGQRPAHTRFAAPLDRPQAVCVTPFPPAFPFSRDQLRPSAPRSSRRRAPKTSLLQRLAACSPPLANADTRLASSRCQEPPAPPTTALTWPGPPPSRDTRAAKRRLPHGIDIGYNGPCPVRLRRVTGIFCTASRVLGSAGERTNHGRDSSSTSTTAGRFQPPTAKFHRKEGSTDRSKGRGKG